MIIKIVRFIMGIDKNDARYIDQYVGQTYIPYIDAYGDKHYKLK